MLSTPILKHLINIPLKYISCGYEHIVGLSLDGKIYSWGLGISGCLGHNNLKNYLNPSIIEHIKNKSFEFIECGGYHTMAISDIGEVYSWGRNDVNQCAVNSHKLYKDSIGFVALRPFKVKNLRNKKIIGLACGEAHSLFITDHGHVLSCGWGDEGQLGVVNYSESINCVNIPERVVKVKCGGIFSAALSENGRVYVWGNGEHGELGLGLNNKTAKTPALVNGIINEYIIDICCGESHTLVMSSEKVFGWGKGIVENFFDNKNYPVGSDIVCYAPLEIKEVSCLFKVLVPLNRKEDFNELLAEKFKKIKITNNFLY